MKELLNTLKTIIGGLLTILCQAIAFAFKEVARAVDYVLKASKLLSLMAGLAALISGVLWFWSATLQQVLPGGATVEVAAAALAETMAWQTYAALASIVAAILSIAAALAAKD